MSVDGNGDARQGAISCLLWQRNSVQIEEGGTARLDMILIIEGGACWRRATPDPVVPLNKGSLKSDLREFARRTVEGVLNGLLEEQADDLAGRGALGVCRGARSVLRRPLRSEPDHVIQ